MSIQEPQTGESGAGTPGLTRLGTAAAVALCGGLTLIGQIALGDPKYAVVWVAGAVTASLVLLGAPKRSSDMDRRPSTRLDPVPAIAFWLSISVMLLSTLPVLSVAEWVDRAYFIGAVLAQILLGGVGLSIFCWAVGLVAHGLGAAIARARGTEYDANGITAPAVFLWLVVLICVAILIGVVIAATDKVVVAAPILFVTGGLLALGRDAVQRKLDGVKLISLLPIALFGAVVLYSVLAAGIAKLSAAEAHFFLEVMDQHLSLIRRGTYMDEAALLGAVWAVLILAILVRRRFASSSP